MKRALVCSFLLGIAAVLGTIELRAADSNLLGPLRTQWDSNKGLIVGMAEAIPEEKFDFKPTPEVRSFREQLQHLVGENYMFMGAVAGETAMDPKKIGDLKSKAELVKALGESYDYGAKVLASLTEEKALESVPFRRGQMPRWAIAMSNFLDNMDHYGNLVVYVRLNGIVPPRSARPATPPPAKQ